MSKVQERRTFPELSMRAQLRAQVALRAAVTPTRREAADRAVFRAARRTIDAMETLKRTLRADVETEEGL